MTKVRCIATIDQADVFMKIDQADVFMKIKSYFRPLHAVKLLGMDVMPNFASKAETAVDSMRNGTPQTIDENEFIDASRLVYDGVS